MALNSLKVSLIASRKDGANIGHQEFSVPLGLVEDTSIIELVCDQGRWRSARATFALLSVFDYSDAKEPHEVFQSAIQTSLLRMADWLQERSPEAFEALRESGVRFFLFFDLVIDQDQMELTLPPALLAAAATSELEIRFLTND